MNSESMSKLRKKTLEAVGWLGSSGYQTIVYSASTENDHVCDNSLAKEKRVPAEDRSRSGNVNG